MDTQNSISKIFNYPQKTGEKLKGFVDSAIRKKAILATKARLAENHKSFDDYGDDELEVIISDEERKIIDDLKTKSLVVALAALGLNFFV